MKSEENYKAAQEWYKIAKEQSNQLAIEILENHFPELKECEDERIRNGLKDIVLSMESLYLQENFFISQKEALAWLEKQGEQKPAEWSEEDEEIMDNLLQHLKVAYSDCEWLEQTINWLKSLRPQNKWKPNDKQMEALRRMKAAIAGEGEIYGPLNSLYEDLKKIKGE